MSMLTKEMLLEMLELQDKINTQIDPNWVKTGNNFLRAAYMEAAEAIDHYGWKWWKKQDPNIPAVQMELVDIWHFYLSHCIVTHIDHEPTDDISKLDDHEQRYCRDLDDLVEYMMFDEDDLKGDYSKNRCYGVIECLEEIMSSALNGSEDIDSFSHLLTLTGLGWDGLYKWYIGKNCLNAFRQNNGYKEGTYIKIWSDDLEDNDYLTDILDSVGFHQVDNLYEFVYTGLEHSYNLVKGDNE